MHGLILMEFRERNITPPELMEIKMDLRYKKFKTILHTVYIHI